MLINKKKHKEKYSFIRRAAKGFGYFREKSTGSVVLRKISEKRLSIAGLEHFGVFEASK